MDNTIVMGFFIWICVGALIGYLCGMLRNREGEGIVLGGLFGIIGWFLIIVGPDERRKCNACKGAVQEGATRCMHCGEQLNAFSTPTTKITPIKLDPVSEIIWAGLEPIYCPGCNTLHSIEKDLLGKGVTCPTCNIGFVTQPIK